MTSNFIFVDHYFLNGNERGKALSRPTQPAPPSPFSYGTTCEPRDEETIVQRGSFFDSIFSSSASLVFFFFFRFRSYFEIEISFSFFFLFSWALTLVWICLGRAWISSSSWCYFQGWRRTDGRSTLLSILFVFLFIFSRKLTFFFLYRHVHFFIFFLFSFWCLNAPLSSLLS